MGVKEIIKTAAGALRNESVVGADFALGESSAVSRQSDNFDTGSYSLGGSSIAVQTVGVFSPDWDLLQRRGMNVDNPAAKYLAIESKVFTPADNAQANVALASIIDETRQRLGRKELMLAMMGRGPLSPKEKLRTVYEVLNDRGYLYEPQDYLTRGLIDKKLDCDTASLVVLAVSYEMNWPVHGVRAPRHFFVRWEEKDGDGHISERFNMDLEARVHEDSYYMKDFYHGDSEIDPVSVSNGTYLRSLSFDEVVSQAYDGVSQTDLSRGDDAVAVVSSSRALNGDPTDIVALSNRARAEGRLREFIASDEDQLQIHQLDPNNPGPYLHQADFWLREGQFQGAMALYQKAIQVSPHSSNIQLVTGLALYDQGRFSEADSYFERSLDLAWTSFVDQLDSGILERLHSRLMPRVIEFDNDTRKELAWGYMDRGRVDYDMGRKGWFDDFLSAYHLAPDESQKGIVRKTACQYIRKALSEGRIDQLAWTADAS